MKILWSGKIGGNGKHLGKSWGEGWRKFLRVKLCDLFDDSKQKHGQKSENELKVSLKIFKTTLVWWKLKFETHSTRIYSEISRKVYEICSKIQHKSKFYESLPKLVKYFLEFSTLNKIFRTKFPRKILLWHPPQMHQTSTNSQRPQRNKTMKEVKLVKSAVYYGEKAKLFK